MKKAIQNFALASVLLIFISHNIQSQDLVLPPGFPAFNISANNSPDDGYLFLNVKKINKKKPSSLVITDNYGTPVFYRYEPFASGAFSLLDNGLLAYRTKMAAGLLAKFYIMDSSYTIIDSVGMDDFSLDSHDILGLENGNYIIFGIDRRTTDLTQYGGLSDATVSGCVVRELDENKDVIFEWNSWDHFEITDTYNDLTLSAIDMVHPNSLEIDYDGNILLISRGMNEITKINRVTGDIIWRLGGKNNQFTFTDTSYLFSKPHNFELLENGNYTLFDNGNERNPQYSRAVEYSIDENNMTIDMVWEYDANKEIFSPTAGSTKRTPSGTTILGYGGTASSPAVIEVHPNGSKAFQLDFIESMSSAKAIKNPWRTNLFEPNTYAVNFGEWEYIPLYYLLTITNNSDDILRLTGYSTLTDAYTIEESFPIEIPANGNSVITLIYSPENVYYGYIEDILTINSDIDSDTLIRRVAQQIKLSGTQLDIIVPEASVLQDGMEGLPVITDLSIIFTEPIKKANDEFFTYLNVDEIVSLTLGSADGEPVPFNAVINTDKNRIDLVPDQPLDHTQTYYISVSDGYTDYAGNQGSTVSGSFKTIDLTSPVASVNPLNGAVDTDPEEAITISFDEPVRNIKDSILTQSSLDSLVILKTENSEGIDVPFTATIDVENTLITILPVQNFSPKTKYHVSISEGIEDFYDNAVDPIISDFTTGFYSDVRSNDYSMFEVFPNPGSGVYQIKMYEADNYTVQLYNMTGKIVYHESQKLTDNFVVDINSLANGLYFLKLYANGTGRINSVIVIKE